MTKTTINYNLPKKILKLNLSNSLNANIELCLISIPICRWLVNIEKIASETHIVLKYTKLSQFWNNTFRLYILNKKSNNNNTVKITELNIKCIKI